jgi:hypothetical protein
MIAQTCRVLQGIGYEAITVRLTNKNAASLNVEDDDEKDSTEGETEPETRQGTEILRTDYRSRCDLLARDPEENKRTRARTSCTRLRSSRIDSCLEPYI